MATVSEVKDRVVGLLTRNGKNGAELHQVPSLSTKYTLPEGIMTTHKLETVCPRCGQSEIDNLLARGVSGEEFHPSGPGVARVMKPAEERPAEVVVGQICRGWVAVSGGDEEEQCGHRLWSAPVPAPGRRRPRQT